MTTPARPTRPSPAALGLGLILALGCDQPTGSTIPKKARPEPVAEQPAEPAPAPPAEAPRTPILGKRTQDIRDVQDAKKAGGEVVQPKITAKDPITLQGNAYVSIIGRSSMLRIEHAMELYKADNDGQYPKTREEFMEKIIKPGISLPRLPAYQDYGYDAANHKLVIIEYPDRK